MIRRWPGETLAPVLLSGNRLRPSGILCAVAVPLPLTQVAGLDAPEHGLRLVFGAEGLPLAQVQLAQDGLILHRGRDTGKGRRGPSQVAFPLVTGRLVRWGSESTQNLDYTL